MNRAIEPPGPDEQRIILHQLEPGDYRVVAAGMVVGSVSRYHAGNGDVRWLWYHTGPRNTFQDTVLHGECESLPLAKQALSSAIRHRLRHAAASTAAIGRDAGEPRED